jgi:hypothetical protein
MQWRDNLQGGDTQLSALNGDTRLVTLTVGGADLNVSGVAAACIPELRTSAEMRSPTPNTCWGFVREARVRSTALSQTCMPKWQRRRPGRELW